MDAETHDLTLSRILSFWSPLAATWLMMAVEGPFLAAVIARLAEPKYNLAGFGVAFSLTLIFQSPVIMLMAAATALVKDADSFRKMRRFTYGLDGAVTAVMGLVLLPPVFGGITGGLMGLPESVRSLAYGAGLLLLPWPAAIGYRRLYQGVLIRSGLTRRVGYGTAVRITAMGSTALTLYALGVRGAYVGAASLSSGVLCEALASRLMARSAVRGLLASEPRDVAARLTYRFIAGFYYPLALSSLLALGTQPVVTFFLAQSRASVESLAVFPVIRSLVFLFSCFGLSYQEVGIALMGGRWEGYTPLSRFAAALGLLTSAGLSALAFTPAADLWFHELSGLSADLTAFAVLPTRLLCLVPGLTVLLSFQRSVFMHARITAPITWATIAEVSGIGVTLYVGIHHVDALGAVAAAASLLVGRICSNVCLFVPRRPQATYSESMAAGS